MYVCTCTPLRLRQIARTHYHFGAATEKEVGQGDVTPFRHACDQNCAVAYQDQRACVRVFMRNICHTVDTYTPTHTHSLVLSVSQSVLQTDRKTVCLLPVYLSLSPAGDRFMACLRTLWHVCVHFMACLRTLPLFFSLPLKSPYPYTQRILNACAHMHASTPASPVLPDKSGMCKAATSKDGRSRYAPVASTMTRITTGRTYSEKNRTIS